MSRINRFKLILWAIVGVAFAVAVKRYLYGLGSMSNLNDDNPWGFWIGFDVVGGVALAAGGFTIAAIVDIFRIEKLHPIEKPAVLTAFLGYLAVVFGLLVDLGLPWNIWHAIIYWNHHSALFEVAWCVMLYTTVLLLEVLPIPLESFGIFDRVRRFLLKYRLVLIILGIMLSTLHQSSLGTLFVIMPYRLHPLWYSPILPIIFFISAVALGLMMVTLESHTTSYLYNKKPETHLLAYLGKYTVGVLVIYAAVRLIDLGVRGSLGTMFENTWQSWCFIIELTLTVLIPVILLPVKKIRESTRGQVWIALSVVVGFAFHRINVAGFQHAANVELPYVPLWSELMISAGVVAFMMLVFFWFIEHTDVWEERPIPEDSIKGKMVKLDSQLSYLGEPVFANAVKFSLAFVIACSVAFAFLPFNSLKNGGLIETPVREARGEFDMMKIDGNNGGHFVMFNHTIHSEMNECGYCHHFNAAGDQNTECYKCHSDMYLEKNIFNHKLHQHYFGDNDGCSVCHDPDKEKTKQTITECMGCHSADVPETARFELTDYTAVAYKDAMHKTCIGCHRDFGIGECSFCHTQESYEAQKGYHSVGGSVIVGQID